MASSGTGGVVGMDAVIAVVDCPFAFVAEDLVGGGDLSEAGGGVWIGAVAVWVVAEG